MPGPVLRRREIVRKEDDGYTLNQTLQDLSTEELSELIKVCDDAIATYAEKRGSALWEHRAPGLGQIPGKRRYETLKRAGSEPKRH